MTIQVPGKRCPIIQNFDSELCLPESCPWLARRKITCTENDDPDDRHSRADFSQTRRAFSDQVPPEAWVLAAASALDSMSFPFPFRSRKTSKDFK